MNVQQKLIDMLIQNGLFESQANEIMKLALPVINKQAEEVDGVETKEDGTRVPINPYKITWDSPCADYPPVMYSVWFSTIKPIAYEWLKLNKPNAWCIELFK